jgi:predicted RNase H-like HicB family nuclease
MYGNSSLYRRHEADPEGGFVTTAPTLSGCYSQSDTLEEAEANITQAIELYFESLKSEHKELSKDHFLAGPSPGRHLMSDGSLPCLSAGKIVKALMKCGFTALR